MYIFVIACIFTQYKTYIFIYLLNKDQNPATMGSACINVKEREKKERKGRDRDTEGGSPKPVPSNRCAHRG